MAQTKERRHAELGAHVGSASIVMIFAVLCLTIFATLAFETASYEQRLAEKSASSVSAYYTADGIAEERYAAIYQLLQKDLTQDALHAALKELDVTVEAHANTNKYAYTVPIDANQQLQVVLLQQADGVLCTQQWNVASATQWDYDDTLQVWDGTTNQMEE